MVNRWARRDPVGYTVGCATRSITPSIANGAILTVMQAASSGGVHPPALPMQMAMNSGFVFTYLVLQCPMEAISGRQSLIHNFIAGGILGYEGVRRGAVGMFNLEMMCVQYRVPIPVGGAIVYGGMAAVLGALGGKSI